MCLRQAFKRKKQVSLVELATKNHQDLSAESKGVCSRQGEKKKKELLLSHTSCCCLLPAASLLVRQVLPYVICLCTEQREKVTSQFGFGRAQSALGNLDESSHFSPCETWVAAGLFLPSTGLKVALLEAGVEERDGSLRDKDLPVLIEVFRGSSFCAAFFFFVFT